MEPFGEQLRKARKRYKMSQDQLSRLTKVTKSAVQSIEVGRTKVPDTLTIMKLLWHFKAVTFEFEYGGKRFIMKHEGLAPKDEP